jgi:hypothetical protein
MTLHSRAAQTTILTMGSALALMTVALGDHAHAEGKLDASYTISFARIRVGEIAATGVFGESEYVCAWPRWWHHESISGRVRALMLRLNRRLGPLSGCRCFNALQIRGQGRAPHVFFLRAFGVFLRAFGVDRR